VKNAGWMMLAIIVNVVRIVIVLSTRMLNVNLVVLMECMVALTHNHYSSTALHKMKFGCVRKVMVVTILGMDLISMMILCHNFSLMINTKF
jgi:hypothetical protein